MRSLEIRTERIFNNLIKQNQKLAADFVRKQSKIVLSAQSPTSSVKSPEFSVHSPTSRVQRPGFRVQRPEFNFQSPASRVQRPESSVQSPASKSCVQSPGIPVCPFQEHGPDYHKKLTVFYCAPYWRHGTLPNRSMNLAFFIYWWESTKTFYFSYELTWKFYKQMLHKVQLFCSEIFHQTSAKTLVMNTF